MTSLDFSQLDALYSRSDAHYISLIGKILRDYEAHKKALCMAYRARHIQSFVSRQHKMQSLLRLLGCDPLLRELQRLSEALRMRRTNTISIQYAEALMDELLEELQRKYQQINKA